MKLKRLNLNGLARLTDASLAAIAQRSTQLTELEMKECNQTSDCGLDHLRRGNAIRLRTFNFQLCGDHITDNGVASICALIARGKADAANSGGRIVLNLGGLPRLTSRSLGLIDHVGDALFALNISKCPLIDEEAILRVLRSCQGLRTLNLSNMPQLSDLVLEDILQHNCYALKKLVVSPENYSEECRQRFEKLKRPGI